MPKTDECFVATNPDWRYFVQVGNHLVQFDPQSGGQWLAHLGGTAFRLLSSEVVLKMLNEGLDAHCRVIARHLATGKTLLFEKPASAKTTKAVKAQSTNEN